MIKNILIKAVLTVGLLVNPLSLSAYPNECISQSGDYLVDMGTSQKQIKICNPTRQSKRVSIYVGSQFWLNGKAYQAGNTTFTLQQGQSVILTIPGVNTTVEVSVSM